MHSIYFAWWKAATKGFLCTLLLAAFLFVHSSNGYAAESASFVDAPMKDDYPAPSAVLIESGPASSNDVLTVTNIREGVPVAPSGFVRSENGLFVIDQAKDRVIAIDIPSRAVRSFTYRTGANDSFTPSDIAISTSGKLVLTDHLVMLKIRAYGLDGNLLKEFSIDPQLALEPLGIVHIKVVSDDVWVQTSDGLYRQIVRNSQSVPYLGQTAITFNTLPSGIDSSVRFDVIKTGPRRASVVIEQPGIIQTINFDMAEDLNAILSLDELGDETFALTMLTGRQETLDMANDARDEIVVVVFDKSGKVLKSVQLPYRNYMDEAFKIVQADASTVTLMNVGKNSAGLYEYSY